MAEVQVGEGTETFDIFSCSVACGAFAIPNEYMYGREAMYQRRS
jgi:hypothetical protein